MNSTHSSVFNEEINKVVDKKMERLKNGKIKMHKQLNSSLVYHGDVEYENYFSFIRFVKSKIGYSLCQVEGRDLCE